MTEFREKPIQENLDENSIQIPKIYRLIESKATTQEIVAQLYNDFYSSDSEKSALALRELFSRENEGLAALMYLAKGTDNLAETAKKILESSQQGKPDIETILGIKRYGRVYDTDLMNTEQGLQSVYQYAQKSGYIDSNMDLYAFLNAVQEEQRERTGDNLQGPTHLTGAIKNEITSTSATFGSAEPTYLELLGPNEILRIRSLENPQFLLLGSLGPYSAREIAVFGKKINPNTQTTVVEKSKFIATRSLEKRDKAKNIAGDATELPLVDNSMDHVYTNKLLGYVVKYGQPYKQVHEKIFREVFRVLKPGGSFVLNEHNLENIDQYLDVLARASGLIKITQLQNYQFFFFNKERSTSTIDENGFPHYENSIILTLTTPQMKSVRYMKPIK